MFTACDRDASSEGMWHVLNLCGTSLSPRRRAWRQDKAIATSPRPSPGAQGRATRIRVVPHTKQCPVVEALLTPADHRQRLQSAAVLLGLHRPDFLGDLH